METLVYNDSAYKLRESLGFTQNVDLAKLVNTMLTSMADGRKIDAIKAYRALTGEGLKPSKDAVESVMPAKPISVYKNEDNEYTYGHYVFRRSPSTELNEFCDAWQCVEGDSTLGYARVRATDAVEMVGEGEAVFIMKVVARSVTTTTMKDM